MDGFSIICPGCGAEYEDGSTYCNICDKDLPSHIKAISSKENLVHLIPATNEFSGLEEFSEYYFRKLKNVLSGFSLLLNIAAGFFVLCSVVGVIMFLYLMSKISDGGGGATAVVYLFYNAVIIFLMAWGAILGRIFAVLSFQKVDYELRNKITYQKESKKMTEEILKKAEQKAVSNITINGDNSVFAFDGGVVSGITQTKVIKGDSELVKVLALLVSYCELHGDKEAIRLSKSFSVEAAKPSPDKGILFTLWNSLNAAVPQISGIVKIAEGIKKLFIA